MMVQFSVFVIICIDNMTSMLKNELLKFKVSMGMGK